MDDDEPRARSNPIGAARAGIQTATELQAVTDGLNERVDGAMTRIIAVEGLLMKHAQSISELVSTSANNLATTMTAIHEVKTNSVSEFGMLRARLDSLAESNASLKDRLDNGSMRIENSFNEMKAMIASLRTMTPPTSVHDPMRTKIVSQPEEHPIGTQGTQGTFHPDQSSK